MGITTSARSLAHRTTSWRTTIGRVDRLMRVCLALSLLMLGGFSIALAGRSSLSGIVFCAAAVYCLVTAGLGTDPVYVRAGIDTNIEGFGDSSADRREPHEPVLPTLTHSGHEAR